MSDPFSPPGLTREDSPIRALLAQMRAGDRDAAAALITRFGPLIRARYRHKLGRVMRRLFDSQELLSTIGRRLDQYVCSGRIRASTEDELWALLRAIADHSLADKVKIVRRLSAVEGEDAPFAREFSARLTAAQQVRPDGAEDLIDRCLRRLGAGVDREILAMWLMGSAPTSIAQELAMTPGAVRVRWHRICADLRRHLSEECN